MPDDTEQIESQQNLESVEEGTDTLDFNSHSDGHKHHPRKVLYNYLALGVLILLILLLVGTKMEYLRPFLSIKGTEITPPVELQQEVPELDIIAKLPPFLPELDWQKTGGRDEYFIYSSELSPLAEYISVSGEYSQAKVTIQDLDGLSLKDNYLHLLESSGDWHQQITVSSVTYSAISAGGPDGDLRGLLHLSSLGLIQVVINADFGDCYQWNEIDGRQFSPPCEIVYEFFISDPVPIAEDDSEWKTYRNDEYGFEFKYPRTLAEYQEEYDSREMLHNDLVFKVEFQEVVTEQERNERLKNYGHLDNIFVRVFKTDLEVRDWLIKNYKRVNTELENYEIGWPIVLGGTEGFFSSTGCCGGTDIAHVVKRGDYIFEFGTNARNLSGEILESYSDSFKFFEKLPYCEMDKVYPVGECVCPSGALESVSEREGVEILLCASEGLSPETLEYLDSIPDSSLPEDQVILPNGMNLQEYSEMRGIEADEMTPWKTYRNDEYGFEFEYPSNFSIDFTEPDSPLLTNLLGHGHIKLESVASHPAQKIPSVGFSVHSHDGGLDSFVPPIPDSAPESLTRTKVTVGGLEAISTSCADCGIGYDQIQSFYVTNNNFGYIFSAEGDAGIVALDSLIKSVSFDTNFKIYRNEEYGFEFQYPSEDYLYIEDEETIESKWLFVEVLPEWDALNGSGVSVSLSKGDAEIFLNDLEQTGQVKSYGTQKVNNIIWNKYQYIDREPTHSTSTHIWLSEINGYLAQVSYWDYVDPTQLLNTLKVIDE